MELSIIILNYNTFALTCDCLRSIFQADCAPKSAEVILVDNGSTEQVPCSFQSLFPQIKFVRSEINLGFAKGNNLGIEIATGEYIVLLNSDTVVKDGNIFERCIQKVKSFAVPVAVTPQLLTADGRPQVAYGYLPSWKYELLFNTFLYRLLNKRTLEKLLISFVPEKNREIFNGYITATFFLFPRRMLQNLPNGKLYDETFLYGEELFWCAQWKKAGGLLFYYSDVAIIHLIGQSSNAAEKVEQRRRFQLRAEYAYLCWQYSTPIALLFMLFRMPRLLILSLRDTDMWLRMKLTLELLMHSTK
ncbi:MAG TPA: glycosyltransferase family 2 protein [Chryseosolibacter sp.]